MYYVYLLTSDRITPRRYIDTTSDLKRRVAHHNSGKSVHTAQHRPWHLITYVTFSETRKALEFERYLKSGPATLSRIATSGERARSHCSWQSEAASYLA